MAIRPILIDKRSPFLGESCALCKEPFGSGQEIIVCPNDATRHHIHCWQLNNNHCTAYGCKGSGAPIARTRFVEEDDDDVLEGGVVRSADSKVRTLPSNSFSCAQGCLIVAIAISIIFFAISCFGIWAILDYIMIEILGWQYRVPISSIPDLHLLANGLNLFTHLAIAY